MISECFLILDFRKESERFVRRWGGALDEGLDLRADREADVRAAAQLLGVCVHLDGWGGRQELVVWEVGAQQDQHVASFMPSAAAP